MGKQRIRRLNKQFRGQDRPTDVLAFSMGKALNCRLGPEILGDVVICPEVAKGYAKIYQTSTEAEICMYLIHGVLHLLGYQDSKPNLRTLMEKEQVRILRKISKAQTYGAKRK